MKSPTHSSACFHGLLVWLAASTGAFGQGWQPAPSFPVVDPNSGRNYAVGINYHGKLVALGGAPFLGGDNNGTVNFLNSPYTGPWQDGGILEGLGAAYQQGGGIDNLDRMIVFSGWDPFDNGAAASAVAYDLNDPNNTQGIAPLPVGVPWRNIAYATDDSHLVYSIGGGPGTFPTGGNLNSTSCVRYIGTMDSWEPLAPMLTVVADAAAVNDGRGHILVLGGYDAVGNRTANVAQYDVATNSWSNTAVADLPTATSGLRAVRGSNGFIYAIGGRQGSGTGAIVNTIHVLNLDTNTWTPGPTMLRAREHFGAALGDDDHIYVMGFGGLTAAEQRECEKLYTPICPLVGTPPDPTVWLGTNMTLATAVTGGVPMTYQWRKGAVNLANGPSVGGGTISGATTTTLTIANVGVADGGGYELVATNPCGTTTSPPISVTIRVPPVLPAYWTVTNLHPAWAEMSSYAYSVSNGKVGGEAITPTLMPDGRTLDLSHPILWTSPSGLGGIDLTPGGSVGGGLRAVSDTYLAGWFWHTWSCYGGGQWWTCAWQSASYWAADTYGFTEAPHGSGPEYDIASATDGQQIVGSLTYEYSQGNYTSYAYMWTPPNSGVSLHPGSVASNSFASAVDGGRQYGGIHTPLPGPVAHAAMWSGSGASFIDLHPAGFTRSWAYGAGDGQAVGNAYIGDASHAVMWVGGASSMVDLTPPGETAGAIDADGGLQVGSIGNRSVVWAGQANVHVDIGAWLPAEMSGAAVQGIDVAPNGTITVVGHGYVPSRSRYEAIMWKGAPASLRGDMNCDAALDSLDVEPFVMALLDVNSYVSAFPACNANNADANADGRIDGSDLASFLLSLMTGN